MEFRLSDTLLLKGEHSTKLQGGDRSHKNSNNIDDHEGFTNLSLIYQRLFIELLILSNKVCSKKWHEEL